MTDVAPLAAEPPRPRRLPGVLRAAAVGAAALALLLLVGWMTDRQPFAFDRAIILALRHPDNLAVPVGPGWLKPAMVDLTALGGSTVLTIVTVAVIGLLLVRHLPLTALLVAAATISGSLLVQAVKGHVDRARPALVPHLIEVRGLSFPSGHSTNSAIVYLTLAGLAAQAVPDRATRNYLLAAAILLVGAIGCSRVYLGVHWPSDVLAGWSFGTLWALVWWWAGASVRAAAKRAA